MIDGSLAWIYRFLPQNMCNLTATFSAPSLSFLLTHTQIPLEGLIKLQFSPTKKNEFVIINSIPVHSPQDFNLFLLITDFLQSCFCSDRSAGFRVWQNAALIQALQKVVSKLKQKNACSNKVHDTNFFKQNWNPLSILKTTKIMPLAEFHCQAVNLNFFCLKIAVHYIQ